MSYVNVEELLKRVEDATVMSTAWNHKCPTVSTNDLKDHIKRLEQDSPSEPETQDTDDVMNELEGVKALLIKQMDTLGNLEDMWEVGVRDGLRQGIVECDKRMEELSQQSTQPPETTPLPSSKSSLHSRITKELNVIYVAKNSDYGDAFGETYKKLGIISAVTRITDKVNRLQSLAAKSEEERMVKDESIIDTLLDLTNYSLMTLIEMGYEPPND